MKKYVPKFDVYITGISVIQILPFVCTQVFPTNKELDTVQFRFALQFGWINFKAILIWKY